MNKPGSGQMTMVITMKPDTGECAQRAEKSAGAAKPARITSGDLLQGRTEMIIVHDGREYRLRVTQNGKLILTA